MGAHYTSYLAATFRFSRRVRGGLLMSLVVVLIIVLLLCGGIGAPVWGYHSYGWYPSGGAGLIVLILVVLLLAGRL